MSEVLPDPLVSSEVDLSDFQYMELDVRRLRDSRFSAAVEAEAFRAGVLLWCASWHQTPASSLPDDDIELALLAGYGRVIKEWQKIREQALTGFVKCNDGRLYHPIVAEKAIVAWGKKQEYSYKKLVDRLRKENKKLREEKQPEFGLPTFEQWKSGGFENGIPAEMVTNSIGNPAEKNKPSKGIPKESGADSGGIPAESANVSSGNTAEISLRGNREGEGTEREQNRDIKNLCVESAGVNTPVVVNFSPPKTPLPPNFGISNSVRMWAKGKGYEQDLPEYLEAFRLKAEANGYTKTSWDSSFKTSMLEDWGKVRDKKKNSSSGGKTARQLIEEAEAERAN